MRRSPALFLICIGLAPVIAIAAWLSYWPPRGPVEPALPSVASGSRARQILDRIFIGVGAHPAGSSANHVVRERLLEQMRSIGLEPLTQEGFVCSPRGTCADVVNVMARVEGVENGAVMLMAHYDSVPAGPGAADDGSGTAAVLESARAILARGTPPRDLIVLITDGEELGLLGATLFVNEHPWMSDVRWVVNSEARGTTGPMLMFETSAGNHALVRSIAAANRDLVTNSLMYTVYKKLPNDTDLTVTRGGGAAGVNFGMIGGGHRYHTPLDDGMHLDQRSLDQATRMVDAAATRILRDAPAVTEGDAVFFDVLGLFVVMWPEGWTLSMALVALLVFGITSAIALRRRGTLRQLPTALGRMGGAVVATILGFYALYFLLRSAGAIGATWPAEPQWMFVAFTAAGVVLLMMVHRLTRALDRVALWVANWLPVAIIAAIAAWLLPGASFVLLVPSIAAALGALLLLSDRGALRAVAFVLPVLAHLSIVAGLLWQFYLGLGGPVVPVIAALVFLALIASLPALESEGFPGGRLLLAVSLGVLAASSVTAALRPVWSVDSPMPLSIQLVSIDGNARWMLPPSAPESMREVPGFGETPVAVYPFDRDAKYLVAGTDEHVGLPNVDSTVERSDGRTRVVVDVAPAAGAHHGMFLPADRIESVEIGGRILREEDRPFRSRIWTVRHQTSADLGMHLVLTLRGDEPLEAWVYERTYGLPGGGEILRRARPEWAAPLQEPDRTVGIRSIRIDPGRDQRSAS